MTKINAAIIGASGYTGAELLRWGLNHPHLQFTALVAESNAGKTMGELYPQFKAHPELPTLTKIDALDWSSIEVAFCCLPHGTSQAVILTIPEHVRVIDLSADFRLRSLKDYEQWYGSAHAAPELQEEAVYGLTEHYRQAVEKARIVACPGCYPTSSLLPLIPLHKAGLLDRRSGIIVDAKSGVTGAGRIAKVATLFP